MDTRFPGKCDIAVYESPKVLRAYSDFLGELPDSLTYADIGGKNLKMDYIIANKGINVSQVTCPDFNWGKISKGSRYDVVFCFEVLEHLQNPLFFMRQLSKMIWDTGVIYLSTPGRPRWMWPEFHFTEYSPEHLERFLLAPLGLRIVRQKRIPLYYRIHNLGIRPILRYFMNATNIYQIIKT